MEVWIAFDNEGGDPSPLGVWSSEEKYKQGLIDEANLQNSDWAEDGEAVPHEYEDFDEAMETDAMMYVHSWRETVDTGARTYLIY